MVTDEDGNDAERQVRLEQMLADFRAAQQRQLVKQGMALWTQTEATYMTAHTRMGPPRTKVH